MLLDVYILLSSSTIVSRFRWNIWSVMISMICWHGTRLTEGPSYHVGQGRGLKPIIEIYSQYGEVHIIITIYFSFCMFSIILKPVL